MNKRSRLIAWANVVIVAIFVILIFSQANKKFALDEVDFPVLAKAISETGVPYHYRGETDPHSLGLWHPPLYAYSLAAFIKVFGFNENIVRAFGMFCTLFSAFLSILIYQKLFKANRPIDNRITPIFFSLFLLHPYTIANTTVPDIDSTVLPIAILGFIYGIVRTFGPWAGAARPAWPVRGVLLLSVLFALNLWTKLTTPLLLIPVALLIFHAKGWPWHRAAGMAIAIAVVGGAIFFSTYGLYCYLLSLPFDFTFRWLLFSLTKNSTSGGDISGLVAGAISRLSYANQFVNWLGLPFIFALALTCGALVFQKARSESDKILLVLGGFGLFVTAFYLGLTGAFGGFFKYPYPVFPILVLVVAHHINSNLFLERADGDSIRVSFQKTTIEIRRREIWLILFGAAAVVVSCYQLFIAKDIVLFENRPVAFSFILSIISIGAIIGVYITKPENPFHAYGLAILLAVMIATQFGISRSQAVAVYPTKYHYGQLGFDETASYLKERLAPNEPIWGMKDIGHYAGTYVENYSSLFKESPEITRNLLDAIQNKRVQYFVLTRGIGQDRVDAYVDLKTALDSCCILDKEFGNFIVYRAK